MRKFIIDTVHPIPLMASSTVALITARRGDDTTRTTKRRDLEEELRQFTGTQDYFEKWSSVAKGMDRSTHSKGWKSRLRRWFATSVGRLIPPQARNCPSLGFGVSSIFVTPLSNGIPTKPLSPPTTLGTSRYG